MSELDFLLNRKKSIEKREEKTSTENTEKREERRETTPVEKKEENVAIESKREEIKEEESRKETLEPTKDRIEDYREDSVESIMKKFLDKDPKIGVWSYPAYLVLQYLYNTKPGFKMSKVAREALEYGLKHMYPDLFSKAEKISQLKHKVISP